MELGANCELTHTPLPWAQPWDRLPCGEIPELARSLRTQAASSFLGRELLITAGALILSPSCLGLAAQSRGWEKSWCQAESSSSGAI